jgi:ferredoxin-NADP reductase
VPDSDLENRPATSISGPTTSFTVYQGRPDVAAVIAATVASASEHDKIVVAVCGPNGMMQDARTAVADNISVNGPGIELHCEHFGW